MRHREVKRPEWRSNTLWLLTGRRVVNIDHVQLAMPEGGEPEARAFFVGLLGMREEAKPAELAARGGCWFRLDTCRVHLGIDADFRPQRKAHPAFAVRDLDELAERLTSADGDSSRTSATSSRRRCWRCPRKRLKTRTNLLRDMDSFVQRE